MTLKRKKITLMGDIGVSTGISYINLCQNSDVFIMIETTWKTCAGATKCEIKKAQISGPDYTNDNWTCYKQGLAMASQLDIEICKQAPLKLYRVPLLGIRTMVYPAQVTATLNMTSSFCARFHSHKIFNIVNTEILYWTETG